MHPFCVKPLARWGWCLSLMPCNSGRCRDFAVSRTGACWKLLLMLRKKGKVAAGESASAAHWRPVPEQSSWGGENRQCFASSPPAPQ